MTARQAIKVRLGLLLVLVIGGAAVFWQFPEIRAIFDEIVLVLKDLIAKNPVAGAVAFILLAAVSAMFSSVSCVPLVPMAVAVWGTGWTMLFLFIGWTGGDVAAYAIGSSAGERFMRHFVSAARLKRWEGHFERGTSFLPALFFKLTTPAETGYLFGMLKYPLLSFLVIILIAEALLAFLAVYASKALLEHRTALFVSLLLAAVAASVAIMVYFRLRRPAKFNRIITAVRHSIKTLKE